MGGYGRVPRVVSSRLLLDAYCFETFWNGVTSRSFETVTERFRNECRFGTTMREI
jgi:hypothetical protein